MYLSGTIDHYDGSLSGTRQTNDGTYWDVFEVDPDYENWFKTVYGSDQNLSPHHAPSHVTVNLRSDTSATIYVKEQDSGTSPSEAPVDVGSTTTGAVSSGSEVAQFKHPIESQYFRVETDISTGTATLCQTVRLKDEYK